MSYFLPFLLVSSLCAHSPIAPSDATRCSVVAPAPNYITVGRTQYLRGNQVAITPLIMGTTTYGHEIELRRKAGHIKAKYFASGAVYQKFLQWAPYNDVVLVCSGAFTNDYRTPMGITIDNGVLVNKLVDQQMDGLVVVYPNGGIAVSNLEEGNLKYGNPETVADLRSYYGLQGFINWAAAERATVFQTQLLAYDNELKLDVTKAHTSAAERRILVIAKNGLGEVLHLVYNIRRSEYLGEIAANILRYANMERGLEVVAMLNLDTGAEDVMEVYNDYGMKIAEPAGNVPITNAINLVAWSYVQQ